MSKIKWPTGCALGGRPPGMMGTLLVHLSLGRSGNGMTPRPLKQSSMQKSTALRRIQGLHQLESDADVVPAVMPKPEWDEASKSIRHQNSVLDQHTGGWRQGEGRPDRHSPLEIWNGRDGVDKPKRIRKQWWHPGMGEQENFQAPSGQRASFGEPIADMSIAQSVLLQQGVWPKSKRPVSQQPLDPGQAPHTSSGVFCDWPS